MAPRPQTMRCDFMSLLVYLPYSLLWFGTSPVDRGGDLADLSSALPIRKTAPIAVHRTLLPIPFIIFSY